MTRRHPVGGAALGPPDPRRYRLALDRWDRVLLAREGARLLARACRRERVRSALHWPAGGEASGARPGGGRDHEPPWRVLELGCRTGRLAALAARLLPEALWRFVQWTGVDDDEDRLALAAARAPEVTWLRHDPHAVPPALPGSPFDLVIVHPWVVHGTPPRELGAFLRRVARLVRRPAEEPGVAHHRSNRPAGGIFLTLYRPVQLVHRWAHEAGGSDRVSWAWAWEGAYDGEAARLELHLLAFVPTATPGRFARLDEVVELYVHPMESLRQAAERAGLTGGDHPVARDGHQALYLLIPEGGAEPSGTAGSQQDSHRRSPA
ncbi:MAG TPA: methyltransferase domain-containing protein [Limnochorda sp.]